MIFLFGDSWARQSWEHSQERSTNGYQHWALPDTRVVNTEDWLNGFFTKAFVVNFARFGNTNEWINRDLFHCLNTTTNLPDHVDFVVFQTDPLRIFAPRQDYNDRAIVWPNFSAWCDQMQFDWQIKNLEDLLQVIYQDWYQNLTAFHYTVQKKQS